MLILRQLDVDNFYLVHPSEESNFVQFMYFSAIYDPAGLTRSAPTSSFLHAVGILRYMTAYFKKSNTNLIKWAIQSSKIGKAKVSF